MTADPLVLLSRVAAAACLLLALACLVRRWRLSSAGHGRKRLVESELATAAEEAEFRPSPRSLTPSSSTNELAPTLSVSCEASAGREEQALASADGLVAELGDELGGLVESWAEFRQLDLLAVGDFASVHRGRRAGERQPSLAIKFFHAPLAPAAGAPGAHAAVASRLASRGHADPRFRPQAAFDAHDADCFAHEVSLLADSELRGHALLQQYVSHGYVETADGPAGFIASELVSGADLHAVLQAARRGGRPCLREGECARWAAQIASAVDHLHTHGVVHRDLKVC